MEQVPVHAAPFDEFAEVLKKLTEEVDILTQMEVQKAHAAANSQHNLIAGFLNPEQAQILKDWSRNGPGWRRRLAGKGSRSDRF